MIRNPPEGYSRHFWMGPYRSQAVLQPDCFLREPLAQRHRSRQQRRQNTQRLQQFVHKTRFQNLSLDDAATLVNSAVRGHRARQSNAVISWLNGSLVPLEDIRSHNETTHEKLSELLRSQGLDPTEALVAPLSEVPLPGCTDEEITAYNDEALACAKQIAAKYGPIREILFITGTE